ncbi:MAG: PASTA domain-containing protein [Bacteroidota bacterium]
MLKDLVAFIFSKDFPKNLIIYCLLIGLLITSIFFGLRFYTNHGETIEVPKIENLHLAEALEVINRNNLRLVIQDSVYVKESDPGLIVSQKPSAFAVLENGDTIVKRVKENRKIYATISTMTPPTKRMPNLIDISERVGRIKLETAGLALGKVDYVQDQIGDNLILEQKYKGKAIKAGDPIKMGEKIDLVVSKQAYQYTAIPDLYGMTMYDAQKLLEENSLKLGIVINCINCNDKIDSSLARIYEQKPRSGDGELGLGGNVDIYLTTDTTGFQ